MLAMFGLFGALMAGLAADALLSGRSADEEDPDEPPPDDEGSLADGNLLDDLTVETGVPVSDDLCRTRSMIRSRWMAGTRLTCCRAPGAMT